MLEVHIDMKRKESTEWTQTFRFSKKKVDDFYSTRRIRPFRYSPSGWYRLTGWSGGWAV